MIKNLCIRILFFLMIGASIFIPNETADIPIKSFSFEDYKEYILVRPNTEYGYIASAEEAKNAAEKIWTEIYGEECVKRHKPYEVSFDEASEIWLVMGTLPKYTVGGVPGILIQKNDGKVIGVWHWK